jgi:hypothetical protein
MLAEIPEIDYRCVKVRETSRNQVLFALNRNRPDCDLGSLDLRSLARSVLRDNRDSPE